MTTSTTRPMEADAHLIEHLLALLWISFEAAAIVLEAMLTLAVAAIALALTITGWRPTCPRKSEGKFPQKSEETPQGKGSQRITTPVQQSQGAGSAVPASPQDPPATAAPRKRAAKRAPATGPAPQPGQAPSLRPQRRRSPAAG
jgi:hypothetical protein